MIRKLYNWVMKWADHHHSTKALALVAFIESSFFIIPPDPLLIGITLNKPKKAWLMALVTTIFSVGGGFVGYLIGYALWDLLSPFFFHYIFTPETFNSVAQKYQENAILALFIAGFTPVPYKAFTIAAGATHLSLLPFFIGSIVGRGARYFLIAGLFYYFGEKAKLKIEKHLEVISIATAVLVILFFVVYKW